MTPEINEKLAPHRDALIFWKLTGSEAGGDCREIAKVAILLGMPHHEIDCGCSGCRANLFEFILNFVTQDQINEYKQRKGL